MSIAEILPMEELQVAPASDIKQRGWRKLMQSVVSAGPMVITNHKQPEAVIVSAQAYAEMLQALKQRQKLDGDVLVQLRQRFDDRLQSLQAEDAADRINDLLGDPVELNEEVLAGEGY